MADDDSVRFRKPKSESKQDAKSLAYGSWRRVTETPRIPENVCMCYVHIDSRCAINSAPKQDELTPQINRYDIRLAM